MKKTIINILILIVVVIIGYLLIQKGNTMQQSNSEYSNSDLGITFSVPSGYVTKESVDGSNDPSFVKTITIITESDNKKELPVGGEGPAVITVNVFENKMKQFPSVWAEKNPQHSNFNLKTSGVSEEVIGGANAVGYMADGLYSSQVFVVAHGKFMYVFIGQFMDAQSSIRADFQSVVESVKFIPTKDDSVLENPPSSAENTPPGSIHNLPVPQAVQKARADLAIKLGIGESKILILEALETEWSDGCLGLGGPAESCLLAITPGYKILMQAQGKEYRYRTDSTGEAVRVEF